MFFEHGDQSLDLTMRVDVKGRLPDPMEPPAAALEIALPSKIASVRLGAMPGVAVALDRQSGIFPPTTTRSMR